MADPSSALDRLVDPADLRDRMTAWRHDHPRATFAEMEVEAERHVAALRAELIAVALAAGEPETAPACPACGATMRRVGTRERTVRTRGDLPVTVTGGRYRCAACGAELFPPRGDS
jgi:hypothetical protein